jgi:hypothetical protein
MNNNYDAVYRNVGTTRRTMHRVEDHYAIHTFKSESEDAIKFFKDLGISAVVLALFGILAYSFYLVIQV